MNRSPMSLEDPGRAASPRLLIFDVLRASAASVVFLFHYASFASPQTLDWAWVDSLEWFLSRVGGLGTNVLLLLSGYFAAQGLTGKPFSYSGFVGWRLARIYIPYLVMLSLAIVFAQISPALSRPDVTALTALHFLAQMLLIPGLFPSQPVLTVTWTLSYIVAGYLLFPLVEIGFRRLELGSRARIVGWAVVTAAVLGLGLFSQEVSVRFSYIPAGFLVYQLHASDGATKRTTLGLSWAIAAALLLLAMRLYLEDHLPSWGWPAALSKAAYSGTGILFVSTIVELGAILQREVVLSRLIPFLPYVAGFGRTSYSFYLVHGPVVKLFALLVFPIMSANRMPAAAYWLMMPACWGLAAVSSLFLYRIVENPLREAIRRVKRPSFELPLTQAGTCGQEDRLFASQEHLRPAATSFDGQGKELAKGAAGQAGA